MALFEDLGWYVPNYDLAEPMTFGKNAGCKILEEKSCPELTKFYPENFCSPQDFKNRVNYRKCTDNKRAQVQCQLRFYESDVEHNFTRFGNEKVAGSFYSDYCPILGPSEDICSWAEQNYIDKLEKQPLEVNIRCVESPEITSECEALRNDHEVFSQKIKSSCETVLCFGNSYQIPSLQATCDHDRETVLIGGNSDCPTRYFTCPPCEQMCSNCSFAKQLDITSSCVSTANVILLFLIVHAFNKVFIL